jgi:TonB family protein
MSAEKLLHLLFPLFLVGCATPEAPQATRSGVGQAAPRKASSSQNGNCCCAIPYPAALRRQGIEGTVVVEFLANVDGSATDAKVLVSSGLSQLDNLAIRAVLSCKGIKPGTVDGVPTAMRTKLSFVWSLSQ